jgi:hypothetical protein
MQPPPPPAPVPSSSGPEVAKKPTDPNLKLLTALLEAASMIVQTGPVLNGGNVNSNNRGDNEDRILGETALGLFAMAFALTEASEDTQDAIDVLRTMAVIYKAPSLKIPAAASSCLIKAGELCLGRKAEGSEHSRAIWDILQALLLAMETGDFVRMQQSIHLLKQIHARTPLGSFQDIGSIVQVAEAVLAQDNDFLHCDAPSAVEHLLLLVNETTSGQESDLLMCRYSSPAVSSSMLEKLQRLIK